MRRRLRLMAAAISITAMAAFLVPLLLSLQRHERTVALAQAQQTASDVAGLAASLGDDPTRLQNYVMSAYGGVPYAVTVWYADGPGVVLWPAGGRAGEPPTELRDLRRSPVQAFTQRSAVAGGYRLLAGGPFAPTAGATTGGDVAPMVELFVPSDELTAGMQRTYVSFGVVAVVILLASLVLADRVAAMRPPASPALEPVREPAPV